MDCFVASIVFGMVIGLLSQVLIAVGVLSSISYPLAICIFLFGAYKVTTDRYFIQRWRRKIGI